VNKYLLDTNVVSELRKPKRHGAVVAWLDGLDASQMFLAAVTLGELQSGIELTRKQDPAKAQEIEAWVDGLAGSLQVLPMDGACFREWARLMHGKRGDLLEDGMIAATARVHA
jgi:toxin FitB